MLFNPCNVLFLSVLLCSSSKTKNSWSYQNFVDWGDVSDTCSTGQKQSPVDLQTKVMGQYDKKAITFLSYKKVAQEMNITNNGHTVEITGTWRKSKPSIAGAIYSNESYFFSNAHLHWSTSDNNGTEHAIEGQKYAAELHLVHVNRKYKNVTEALEHEDGLAVVGMVFKVDDEVPPNPGMAQFAALAQKIRTAKSARIPQRSFNLNSFIPNPLPPLYTYDGSLTTPPCTENVRWAVLSNPQPINSEIIELFRKVKLAHHDTNNYRPLQKLNNRVIELDP